MFEKKRKEMIQRIISFYGLNSPQILSVMGELPRHAFVGKDYNKFAYNDRPIPIGLGQTMSQPYTVAFMTELLLSDRQKAISDKTKNWKVLEVGTGSGYQAAVLSRLVKDVYTIEVIPELALKSLKILRKFKYLNVHVKEGSGEWGWEEHAPYDAILVTAGVEKVPQALFDQLKVEGVLVIPVGKGVDKVMTRFTKRANDRFDKTEHGVFHFVPFIKEDDTITL